MVLYCIKFLVLYCFLYYGTRAIIGLSVHPGYYSPLVHDFLDYPSLLRKALMNASKSVLELFGHQTEIISAYRIRMVNGRGVKIVYDCLGIGLFSFWTAFIIANDASFKKKLLFIIGGIAMIFAINVGRIALLVLAANNKFKASFTVNHHAVFNIVAYTLIIVMIFIYDRSEKNGTVFRSKKATA
jgi:exosortase/archaeosortase family protein